MLKSLLSLLLSKFYSKQESALVAEQALPNEGKSITISLVTGQNGTYTAPEDGYVNICTKQGGNINVWGECLQASNFANTNGQAKIFIPLRKGKTVWYDVHGEILAAQFFKLVGGGVQTLKNALLQGGGLCLNSLSSSLRRSSCRVRDRGFNTPLVRPWMQRPSALQPTVVGTSLHPAGTVMSHTQETPQALFWKSLEVAQGLLILNCLQDGILFLYRKVKNLVISFQQIQQCRICTLSLCEEKTNFAVGGASC